jgi:hypothetical protein
MPTDDPGRYTCPNGHSTEVGQDCDICEWDRENAGNEEAGR